LFPYLLLIRFDSKYSQIDKLFIDGFTIKDLKKTVSPGELSNMGSIISPEDQKDESVDSQEVTEKIPVK
jgi:hypothetical protein